MDLTRAWAQTFISYSVIAAAAVGCGGGQNESGLANSHRSDLVVASSASRASSSQPLAAAAAPLSSSHLYGSAAPADAAEQLLNFAESHFPQYFPSQRATQSFDAYLYRHYPETGMYVGVAKDVTEASGLVEGGVYVMGGEFGLAPSYVGSLSNYITVAPGVTMSAPAPATLQAVRVEPTAAFVDEFANATIRVEVMSEAKGLQFTAEFSPLGARSTDPLSPWNGVSTFEVPLYDDGTHGDQKANDGIFTGTLRPGFTPILDSADGKLAYTCVGVRARDAQGVTVPAPQLGPAAGDCASLLLAVARGTNPPLNKVADNVYSTGNFVNIVAPVASMYFAGGADYVRDYLARKIFRTFPDVFDAITESRIGVYDGSTYAKHVALKNTVSGIGIPIFDMSSSYHSARLSGWNYGFGSAFHHEFAHTYTYFLNEPELSLAAGGAHPGVPSTEGAFMGGTTIKMLDSGDYYVLTNSDHWGEVWRYSSLELYLMGLLPASQVETNYYLLDRSYQVQLGGTIPASKVTAVSIEDIMRVYGPRVPDSSVAPKTFRVLALAVSERPLTHAEVGALEASTTYLTGKFDVPNKLRGGLPSFYFMTRGLGAVDVSVPAPRPK